MQAAIGLGDWLLRQPEITDAGRAAIEHLKTALCRLPQDTPNLCAHYDFVAWPTARAEYRTMGDYPWDGIARTWGVGMHRGTLEIGSTFNTHASASPWDEDEHELWFHIDADGRSYAGTYNFDRWIHEVGRLDHWRGALGVTLKFEASCSGSTLACDHGDELAWEAEVPVPNLAAWATRAWGPDPEQAAHDRRHFSGDDGEYDSVSKTLDGYGLPLPTVLVKTPTRVTAPLTFAEMSESEIADGPLPSFLDIRRPLDLDFQPEEAEDLGLHAWGASLHSALSELRRRRYDGLTYFALDGVGDAPCRLWVPLDSGQIVEGDAEQAARRLNQNTALENWARFIGLYESKIWTRRTKPNRPQRRPREQPLVRSARKSRGPRRSTY